MAVEFDPEKRRATLDARGLDFAEAEEVFAGPNRTWIDDRIDYGESRYITAGWLRDRFVVVVWTPRNGKRRIISMRYGHDRERRRFQALDRS